MHEAPRQRSNHFCPVEVPSSIGTDEEQVSQPSTWALPFRMHCTLAGSEKSQQKGAIVSCRPP